MNDAMGIYQHHDAVTGTARQAVANDYAFRLSNAMESNFEAYAAAVDLEIKKMTGVSSNGTWQFCQRNNGTYLDCPISKMNFTQGS